MDCHVKDGAAWFRASYCSVECHLETARVEGDVCAYSHLILDCYKSVFFRLINNTVGSAKSNLLRPR